MYDHNTITCNTAKYGRKRPYYARIRSYTIVYGVRNVRPEQIQDLYNQLKININNWKNKWLKLGIDIQQFEKAFRELVDYLKSSFGIMSTIFEHVSVIIIDF